MTKQPIWFGDTAVSSTQEKTQRVHAVFNNVAQQYDVMNDAMSLGVHRLWKRAFIQRIRPQAGQVIADLAGGTGDIACALYRASGRAAQITVCDLTPAMVQVGRNRALDAGISTGIHWVVGNAELLPLADNSCDLITIAFGLRNVADIDKALRDMVRVLKPGGVLWCLEFSAVQNPALAHLYRSYSDHVIPALGQWIADDKASYEYLVQSIRRFPDQAALCQRMQDAGFAGASYTNLTNGVVAIHRALKP